MRGITRTASVVALAWLAAWTSSASSQEARHFRFAYDQPRNTGYSLAGDIFADKLKELSKGTMIIDQYPGAQLGQEPQVLQLMKAGDIEFCISAAANAATLSPQAGVMSLHFLFRSEDHLKKSLADPKVVQAVKDMIEDTKEQGEWLAMGRRKATAIGIDNANTPISISSVCMLVPAGLYCNPQILGLEDQ